MFRISFADVLIGDQYCGGEYIIVDLSGVGFFSRGVNRELSSIINLCAWTNERRFIMNEITRLSTHLINFSSM